MTNFSNGHEAETAAAEFLVRQGYHIIEQNWRTPRCEIDIVAERNKTIYFCEVKYRRTSHQGFGLEYITPKKLAQMQYAAQVWVHVHHWRQAYQLAAIEVSGPTYEVTAFVEDV